ncbi:hypothetical protein QT196_38830 (plasmid) [Streptomyces sp. P9-2B-2]|uniref:hypothetical protein n=1 Tax=Streptomyces sp. P9-2B-2 TaxID=3057114 RepID=UPI0025B49F97|nr:hypothetical protein [Streptomyces sp. P9-2B-2]WJY43219.1 hypothetical protein QT196_38830 [Streptomyces sp. P9-2B-2]
MSTTHDHHSPRGDIAPYEGEFVWAEIVDDQEPGPHSNEDQEQPADTTGQGPSTARRTALHAATVLRAVAGHTRPGLGHAWAAISHWTTLGYMSDEEIRRRLVKRYLDTYIEQREDITADINRLGKKAQKITRDAVDFGLTAEEGRRLKDVGTELKLRRTAGSALTKIPFDVAGAQPTGDQVRRYRSVRALGRFVGVLLPAGATTLGVVLAAPLAGLVAVPVLAGAAWWLGRHPLALTQRALPADLVGPRELEPLPKATGETATATAPEAEGEVLPEEVIRLNAALTAAGLLNSKNTKGIEVLDGPDYSVGNGYTMTADLPKGGGKLVKDVIGKTEVIAGELGIPPMQLIIREVPASDGGHGRRMHVWEAEKDPYLAVGHATSPLATAESWDFWAGTPLGQTVLGEAKTIPTEFAGGFTSHFYSGIMRFGKTAAMRLDVAAGLLDPGVRLYLANGKGGTDWESVASVAHRFTEGTNEAGLTAFEDLLEELVEDMNTRYADLKTVDVHLVPDGRLTPELARKHGLPVLLAVIDELQLYLLALPPKRRERALEKLKNLLRAGPAAGVFLVVGTQRPDGEEVPTGFRDLFGVRVSVRCLDSRSSRMSLGDLASDAGADASVLTEDHVGVVVAATGHRWEILSADFLRLPDFAKVCQRARQMREQAGTLTGDAAGQPRITEPREVRAVRACLAALDEMDTDRARVETLAAAIGDDGEFEDIDKTQLGALLRKAGCGNVVSIGAVDNLKNAKGYKRPALEDALSVEDSAA